jgi:hypothetical protein
MMDNLVTLDEHGIEVISAQKIGGCVQVRVNTDIDCNYRVDLIGLIASVTGHTRHYAAIIWGKIPISVKEIIQKDLKMDGLPGECYGHKVVTGAFAVVTK